MIDEHVPAVNFLKIRCFEIVRQALLKLCISYTTFCHHDTVTHGNKRCVPRCSRAQRIHVLTYMNHWPSLVWE